MLLKSVAFGNGRLDNVRKNWSAGNGRRWIKAVRSNEEPFRKLFLEPSFDRFIASTPVEGKTVLDLGCGEGVDCRRFNEKGAKVTGVDISPTLIKAAREASNSKNINYVESSFTALGDIVDNSFDQVVSVMALMDSPEVNSAFKEAYRVLKPGGSFYFVIKHPFTNRANKAVVKGALTHQTSYFESTPFNHTLEFQSEDVKNKYNIVSRQYPRTLSQYINPLLKAGFNLKAIEEPSPSSEALNKFACFNLWAKEPFYLMVHAKKPE